MAEIDSQISNNELMAIICESMTDICTILCIECNNPHFEKRFESQSNIFDKLGKALRKRENLGENDG